MPSARTAAQNDPRSSAFKNLLENIPRDRLLSFLPGQLLRDVYSCEEVVLGMKGFDAAALFVDISGFSDLSFKLSKLTSDGGAEILTAQLNAYFEKIISVIDAHGGDVLLFSGDALLVAFTDDIETMLCRKALHCGLQLLTEAGEHQFAVKDEQQLTTTFRMGLHIGAAYGLMHNSIIGGAGSLNSGRWKSVVHGGPVVMCGVAANLGGDGQFFTTHDLVERQDSLKLPKDHTLVDAQALGESRAFVEIHPENYAKQMKDWRQETKAEKKARDSPSASPPVSPRHGAVVPIREIRSNISINLAGEFLFDAALASSGGRSTGQLRTVSTVFVKLAGVSPNEPSADAHIKLHRAVRIIQKAVNRLDGLINKVIMDDKGIICVCVFGIPRHSHEDDPQRSVLFATKCSVKLAKVVGANYWGIARALVFCGTTGAKQRREYTVLGDGVNLAARLMSKAQNHGEDLNRNRHVLCDLDTTTYVSSSKRVGASVAFIDAGDVLLKGRDKPIEVYHLVPDGEKDRLMRDLGASFFDNQKGDESSDEEDNDFSDDDRSDEGQRNLRRRGLGLTGRKESMTSADSASSMSSFGSCFSLASRKRSESRSSFASFSGLRSSRSERNFGRRAGGGASPARGNLDAQLDSPKGSVASSFVSRHSVSPRAGPLRNNVISPGMKGQPRSQSNPTFDPLYLPHDPRGSGDDLLKRAHSESSDGSCMFGDAFGRPSNGQTVFGSPGERQKLFAVCEQIVRQHRGYNPGSQSELPTPSEPHCVRINGAIQTGKSMMLTRCRDYLRGKGVRILVTCGIETSRNVPYGTIRALVQDLVSGELLDLKTSDESRGTKRIQRMGQRRASVSRDNMMGGGASSSPQDQHTDLVAMVKENMPLLSYIVRDVHLQLPSQEQLALPAREKIARINETLKNLIKLSFGWPVTVLLDDMQFVDEASASLFVDLYTSGSHLLMTHRRGTDSWIKSGPGSPRRSQTNSRRQSMKLELASASSEADQADADLKLLDELPGTVGNDAPFGAAAGSPPVSPRKPSVDVDVMARLGFLAEKIDNLNALPKIDVSLKPLEQQEHRALLSQCYGGPMDPILSDLIFQKTEGVPGFAVHIANHLAENKQVHLRCGQVTLVHPGTQALDSIVHEIHGVEAAVMNKVDHLPSHVVTALHICSCLQVEGSFEVRLFDQVYRKCNEKTPQDADMLQCLVDTALVKVNAAGTEIVYGNRLLRDAVYLSMLRSDRQKYHALAARTLEKSAGRFDRSRSIKDYSVRLAHVELGHQFDLASTFELCYRGYLQQVLKGQIYGAAAFLNVMRNLWLTPYQKVMHDYSRMAWAVEMGTYLFAGDESLGVVNTVKCPPAELTRATPGAVEGARRSIVVLTKDGDENSEDSRDSYAEEKDRRETERRKKKDAARKKEKARKEKKKRQQARKANQDKNRSLFSKLCGCLSNDDNNAQGSEASTPPGRAAAYARAASIASSASRGSDGETGRLGENIQAMMHRIAGQGAWPAQQVQLVGAIGLELEYQLYKGNRNGIVQLLKELDALVDACTESDGLTLHSDPEADPAGTVAAVAELREVKRSVAWVLDGGDVPVRGALEIRQSTTAFELLAHFGSEDVVKHFHVNTSVDPEAVEQSPPHESGWPVIAQLPPGTLCVMSGGCRLSIACMREGLQAVAAAFAGGPQQVRACCDWLRESGSPKWALVGLHIRMLAASFYDSTYLYDRDRDDERLNRLSPEDDDLNMSVDVNQAMRGTGWRANLPLNDHIIDCLVLVSQTSSRVDCVVSLRRALAKSMPTPFHAFACACVAETVALFCLQCDNMPTVAVSTIAQNSFDALPEVLVELEKLAQRYPMLVPIHAFYKLVTSRDPAQQTAAAYGAVIEHLARVGLKESTFAWRARVRQLDVSQGGLREAGEDVRGELTEQYAARGLFAPLELELLNESEAPRVGDPGGKTPPIRPHIKRVTSKCE